MVESFRDRPYAARRFREIVEFARRSNPFYARWITDPENPPVLDRATALEHNDEILGGWPETGKTSGSTSIPVRFSQSDQWRMLAGRDVHRFIGLIGGKVPTAHIVFKEGAPRTDVCDVGRPLDEQIRFIFTRRQEIGVTAVTTYPSNAELLCRAVVESGVDMGFITRFGMYAEAVEPYHRELVAKAFPNARIWTTYSTKEFDMVAWMCPFEPEFHHITAHRLGVEVLRDDGSPALNGETGRVVVTDYLNRRSPFIRYELGDLAVPGACPCGRFREPAFQRILGKVVGTILHRDGHRVIFSELSAALREIPGMRQYQVIQETLEEFTVKVVADGTVEPGVAEAFESCLGYTPESIRVERVTGIPRGTNGKTYWCYSHARA